MTIEELHEKILQLTEQNEQLSADNEQYKQTLETKDKRISELEGYNQKLFMRVTSKVDIEETENQEVYVPTLINQEQYDVLSENEKEELRALESEVIG